MTAPAGPAPLRFLSRETVGAHLPPGPVREQAEAVRQLVDQTEAAAGRVFALGRPELDRQAQSEDAAAISAALAAPQWSDPNRPPAVRPGQRKETPVPDLDSQIAQASAHLQELLAKKSPAQLDRAAVKSMTPDQIEQARVDGRLNDLLGIK